MLLGELITLVQDKVNRPDLTTEIYLRTLQSVRVLHMLANFDMDREEFVLGSPDITFQNTDNVIGSVAKPRDLRDIEMVHGLNQAGRLLGAPIVKQSLEELAKLRKSKSDSDTYYMNGGRISFKAKQRIYGLLVSGFVYKPGYDVVTLPLGPTRDQSDPVIQNYTDWMLEMYPIAVVDHAISYVASAVGDIELANYHRKVFDDFHHPLLLNHATS